MIHIKRSSALGDVLWIEPIVRQFISEEQRVNIITLYPELFENYPSLLISINEPIFGNVKCRKFNRFIQLDGVYEANPKMHILEAYCRHADVDMPLSYPKLYLSEEEKRPLFRDRYAVLHIEKHPSNYRNVYGVDWNEVVSCLRNRGCEVLQISFSGEDLYGQWMKLDSLRRMMTLIYGSRLFIGLDSGPSHIAAALKVPSVLFFGSVNPSYRHLKDFNGVFMQGACEYAHCYHEVENGLGKPCRLVKASEAPKCSIHTTERVLEAIEELMKRQGL